MFQRTVIFKHTLVFISVDIRCFLFRLPAAANAPFAAVAGEVLAAIGEFLHGNKAAVAAALAAVGTGLHLEVCEFICRQQLRFLLTAFQRQNGRTVSAHQAGDIGPYNLPVEQLFQATQHSVIIECTALYDNMAAQLTYVFELHNLEQGVLDDRERDTGGNIRYFGAFFLRLFDLGIHEHRTTCAQIHGCLGGQCFLRKFRRRHRQAFGKVLDKGAAAGRAGLIQSDIADTAVFDKETLHVLTADIQHKSHFRAKFLRCPQMRKGFYLTAIGMQSRLDNGLTITRGHGAGHIGLRRHSRIQSLNLLYHRGQR